MTNMFCISPTEMDLPVEMRHLRVAAYCRVSTEQEEQDSSIRLQELHYTRLINGNPNWENAGIFSEKATGLNIRERNAFQIMINRCKRANRFDPDEIYQPLWPQYTGCAPSFAGSS